MIQFTSRNASTSSDGIRVIDRVIHHFHVDVPLPKIAAVMNRLITAIKIIVDRYDDRFELLRYLLNVTSDSDADALVVAKKTMAQFRVMLHPYILHTAVPVPKSADNATALSARLAASEQLLLSAVEEANREICRVVVGLWAEDVAAGLDDALPVEGPAEHDGPALEGKWKGSVDDLMAWLE
ncbi:hypothetical protein GGX14DRAFT_584589 [Mycena pura]|uniref:Uncharacterized protein n=1 Tax=Mycena pura TaxID=153505 RepID=A0AAD6VTA1_9AGAR|nr:hypothetical protein GGX14DRAFT_584589 [Mycena pura]